MSATAAMIDTARTCAHGAIRITKLVGHFSHKASILPGARLFTTLYNKGLPANEQITCIHGIPDTSLHIGYKLSPLAYPGYVLAASSAIVVVGVADSGRSFGLAFRTLYNLGLDPNATDHIRMTGDREDRRHPVKKFVVGAAGLALGGATAVPIIIAADTIKSMALSFRSIYNAGLDPNACDHIRVTGDREDNRHIAKKYVIGAGGIVLGAAVGIPTTVIVDTLKSLVLSFGTIYNAGLDPNACDHIRMTGDRQDNRHIAKKYAIGAAGITLGAAIAIPTTVVIDSIKSFILAFRCVYAAGLGEGTSATDIIAADKRHAVKKYAVGSAGYVTGAVLSAAVTTFIDTFRSFTLAFRCVYAAGLGEGTSATDIIAADKRHAAKKYGLGAVGYAVGAALSAIATVFIDTWRSFILAFRCVYAPGQGPDAKSAKDIAAADKRHAAKKYGLGAVGYAAGAALSAIATVFIDTWRSFILAFRCVYAAGLGEGTSATDIIAADKRHAAKKYGLGAVGYAAGAALSAIATVFIDTWRSFILAFRCVYARGQGPDAKSAKDIATEDKRHPAKRYGLGAVGYAAGAALSAIASVFIDTWRSFILAFRCVYARGQGPDAKSAKDIATEDKRHPAKKYGLGAVGYAAGAALSAIASVFIDTWRSFILAFRCVYARGQGPDAKSAKDIATEDKRHPAKKYGLGAVGYAVGAALSAIASVFIDTWRSLVLGFRCTYALGQGPDAKSAKDIAADDKRHPAKKYGIGAAGYAVGAALSAIASVFIDTWRSFALGFRWMYNLGLNPATAADHIAADPNNDQRHAVKKYVIGGAGLVLGAIVGFVAKTITTIGRFFRNMAKHFVYASRSLLNNACERVIFKNMEQDRGIQPRSTIGEADGDLAPNSALARIEPVKKAFRAVARVAGTVLAAITTGILSLGIFILRKIPTAIGMALGFACTPITATARAIHNCSSKQRRFAPQPTNQCAYTQEFKNLYSSLTGLGQLPAGKAIMQNANGRKTRWNSARKCMFAFYATVTPTERTLDVLLQEFRNFQGNKADFFADGNQQFQTCIDTLKLSYTGCLYSAKQSKELQAEVDEVADFVKTRMQNLQAASPVVSADFYKKLRPTFAELTNGTPATIAAG